jgi:hypothetical protein
VARGVGSVWKDESPHRLKSRRHRTNSNYLIGGLDLGSIRDGAGGVDGCADGGAGADSHTLAVLPAPFALWVDWD